MFFSTLLTASPYVVYDTSVWTWAGYTIQRYIGSSVTVGIMMLVPVFGISVVIGILKYFAGRGK